VDGNEYIDYTLAHGPLILGHCHPEIVAAVERQLRRGSTYGCQHELEPKVTEQMLRVLPWADRVVFNSTGTEAVQAALRLARAATGRNLIIKFEGAYHGWADSVFVGHRHSTPINGPSRDEKLLGTAGQSPSVLKDILILPWNDLETLEFTFSEWGQEVAAVITEPMQCNTASILPAPGFLERLRELTVRHSAVLIFDEVITGFHLAAGGASEYFEVAPDLSVFGKALAGGYALSAVAGRDSVMRSVETGRVLHYGTFNGNPISMAAASATLEILLDRDRQIFPTITRLGAQLMHELRALCKGRVPSLVQGVPACFHLMFTEEGAIRNYADFLAYDMSLTHDWLEEALQQGIFQMRDARWYVSGVHTDEDISITLEKAERVLKCLASRPKFSAGLRSRV
jgi:glutamate-1-semialdehyde 2,1-aminomutase